MFPRERSRRPNLPTRGSLFTSEAGISPNMGGEPADNARRFNNLIKRAFAENKELVVEGWINVIGQEIWVNPDADPFSYRAGTILMRGVAGRDTRLIGGYVTFGKCYRLISGVPTFDLTRDPSFAFIIQNIHFEGVTRFMNIEATPRISFCSFFASDEPDFYSAANAGARQWGIGNAVTRTITTPYPYFPGVVEGIACNHTYWEANNVQDGITTLVGGNGGYGMLCSQFGNSLFHGGRIVNCDRALVFEAHPVYGLQGSDSMEMIRTHFESNRKECLKLDGVVQAVVDGHFQGGNGVWDMDNYPMVRCMSALGRNHIIGGHFVGINQAKGVAIQADSVQGIHVWGSFDRLATIASFGNGVDGYSFAPSLGMRQIKPSSRFLIASGAQPYRWPAEIDCGYTPIDIFRSVVALQDSFLGSAVNTAQWTLRKGTDTECVDFAIPATPLVGGGAQGTTGDAASGATPADTAALNGVQMFSALNWQADQGLLEMECLVKVDNRTVMAFFVGFMDQNAAVEMPCSMTGGTVTVNPATANATGFYYDAASTNDRFMLIGVKDSILVAPVETAYQPAADVYVRLRITLDTDGTANFYRNGELLSQSELVPNPNFTDATGWNFGGNWTWNSDDEAAEHAAGATTALEIALSSALTAGQVYTLEIEMQNRTAGSITPALTGGATVLGTTRSADGTYEQDLTATAAHTTLTLTPTSPFVGQIKTASLRLKGLANAVSPSVPLCVTFGGYSTASGQPRILTWRRVTTQQKA